MIGIPDCVAEGRTEAEAIANAQATLRSRLVRSKVLTIEVENSAWKLTDNPWLKSAGIFKDDPTWDDFQAEIAKYRRELDAEEGRL